MRGLHGMGLRYGASFFLLSAVLMLPVSVRAATFVVTNTASSGAASLAQAIADANATPAEDLVVFNIAGVGPHVIGGSLPPITQPLVIDGSTQPGSVRNTVVSGSTNAVIAVQLDGSSLPIAGSVVSINSLVTLRGLSITGFGSKGSGVFVSGTAIGATLDGCFVCVAPNGSTASGNGTGVIALGPVTVGLGTAASRNLISGCKQAGVTLRGTGALLRGNLIGTNSFGKAALGNGTGVLLTGSGAAKNVIGGVSDSDANVIAASVGAGVRLDASASAGNRIIENRIFSNGGLGIDLGNDGVTFNDLTDADTGPNNLQNFPEIAHARINGNKLLLEGLLRSSPGSYTINFFSSTNVDSSEFGEGQAELGKTVVVIPSGSSTVRYLHTITLATSPTEGFFVTATAESVGESQDTSEFSRGEFAVIGGDVLAVTNTNDSGTGSLRSALASADANPDPNTIVFNIPGPGPHVIQPASGLAAGTPIILDGYSQAGAEPNALAEGSDADIRVEIDASGIGAVSGLTLFDTTAVVRGLALHGAGSIGIRYVRCENVRIEGCFLGLDASGNVGLGNAGSGVGGGDSFGSQIGGGAAGNRNLIAGNSIHGVADGGIGTRILGNMIGLTRRGSALGNGASGVLVGGSGTSVVGGIAPGDGNVIAHNGAVGVLVGESDVGVRVSGNSIFDNGGQGINLLEKLNGSGLTLNDADDLDGADDGGNRLQNFPVIAAAELSQGVLTLEGTLDVTPSLLGSTFRIDAFANAACDANGHGEGKRFLGWADVIIGNDEAFTIELPVSGLGNLTVLATTATDLASNETSEFSECVDIAVSEAICGDASGDGNITSGDALTALRTAVDTASCQLCACDVNDSGGITTADALAVLRKAVGQVVTLTCPPCS